MDSHKKLLINSLLSVLIALALAMAVLFPVLLFLLPLLLIIQTWSQVSSLPVFAGFLFQLRTVCQIE